MTTLTIRALIDVALAEVPGAPFPETVDTIKSGDADQPVTGVVTTFLATSAVIERAAELGANLIITHEPTYYNHLDQTDWLRDDPVFAAKRRLIESRGITIWRFHDHWHSTQPDGIVAGMLRLLGWEQYADADQPTLLSLPPLALSELAEQLKAKLGVAAVRVAGPAGLICKRVGLVVGSPGGEWQIKLLGRPDVDALVCGEINEWETCEYVRDAERMGIPKGLIVVGHAASEEGGMAYLADWLGERVPGIPIAHVPAGDPLRIV